jgi:hypothetical protein
MNANWLPIKPELEMGADGFSDGFLYSMIITQDNKKKERDNDRGPKEN